MLSAVVKITLFCAIILVTSCESTSPPAPPTEVTDFIIVYDAGHTPSIEWFKKEFAIYQDFFSDFVNFVFSPCQLIKVGADHKSMTCGEADPTCLMNKLHACANEKITDYHSLIDFITCSIAKGADAAIKQCIKDEKLAAQMDTCSKGDEGFQTCVKYSKSVDKPIPVELIPFINMPTNFYGYKPYLTTDSVCLWLSYPRPPKCPKDV